jgi:uncharacterized protein GlcG (DUF336 family)
MTLGLEEARELIRLAQEKGAEGGKAITVAVVDAGGFVVAIERQTGARPLTPSIALSKAYTAAVMQRPTRMLNAWAEKEPAFFTQVGRMGMHPIVAGQGGITIKREGELIGGLGVSGATPEEDERICSEALAEAGYELEFEAWGQVRK